MTGRHLRLVPPEQQLVRACLAIVALMTMLGTLLVITRL